MIIKENTLANPPNKQNRQQKATMISTSLKTKTKIQQRMLLLIAQISPPNEIIYPTFFPRSFPPHLFHERKNK